MRNHLASLELTPKNAKNRKKFAQNSLHTRKSVLKYK